ncbi:mucin-5B-like isoform X3 [Pseudoliparis swirei]|uniref:mucin-5B-like isoform X3 n=1 Tax=Pseudoliparis swirei TaxID=2059687 RepID=UPI0024BEEF85|nr:mucin-5B-like isoform X3 [Pseudoliparis swirei]
MIIWRSLISPTEVDNTKLFILDGETWVFAEKVSTIKINMLGVVIFCGLFFASQQQDGVAFKMCWTEWFDRDDPSGSGDWETLVDLHKVHPGKICPKPAAIEAQTLTGLSVAAAGEVIQIDTTSGFVCRNKDQPDKRCNDYRVRFSCPASFCDTDVCWTKWFDRDNPSGSGDWETLVSLHKENPGKICPKPTAIEAQTLTGLSVAAAGEVIQISDTTTGFVCRNEDQPDKRCNDYRVRFSCPASFCDRDVCWTKWFDRDDPSGSGDWETLVDLHKENPGKICPKPAAIEAQTLTGLSVAAAGEVIQIDTTKGFVCRNKDQPDQKCNDYRVRFSCPASFCDTDVCWTDWYDRDDPSGNGDWETLVDLQKENPGEICEHPLHIEAVTTDTNTPSTSTGDKIFLFCPSKGFICRNEDQECDKCLDYKVRFGCSC